MSRDEFDRYERELVKAARRLRLGRRPPLLRRRARRHVIAGSLASAAVAVAFALMALTSGTTTTAAQAQRLLVRARQMEASAPACRKVSRSTQPILLGVEPLPATAHLIGALRRPQTPAQRALLRHIARVPLESGAFAEILGNSLRTLETPGGLSALFVVTRALPTGSSAADPIDCLLHQRSVLPRLSKRLSRAALARAEMLLMQSVTAKRISLHDSGEGIYVIFKDRQGHTIGRRALTVKAFAREGAIIHVQSQTTKGPRTHLIGMLPGSVHLIELGSVHSMKSLTRPVVQNLFSVVLPREFGRSLELVWRGAHRLQRHRLTLSF